MLIYLWAQFVAAGKAMMTILEWSYLPAVALSAIVIIIYTFQGGYRAVAVARRLRKSSAKPRTASHSV